MLFFSLQDVQSGSQPSPRRSFGSSNSDNDRPRNRRAEPAYSFVGMHCIFDQCKASGNFFLQVLDQLTPLVVLLS